MFRADIVLAQLENIPAQRSLILVASQHCWKTREHC